MKPLASLDLRKQVSSLCLQVTRKPVAISLFITLLAIISLWPFAGGEDVANSRENILNGERTDFWGGFSQFFYSLWGLGAPTWHIILGVIQALLVLTGTVIAIQNLRSFLRPKAILIPLFLLHYLATIYVLNLSRDATLLAFLWIGIALLFRITVSTRNSLPIAVIAILLICIGFAFRPWLAIAFTPIVLTLIYISRRPARAWKKIVSFTFIFLMLSAGPLALDLTSKNLMELEESYPEQQVMILDIASMVCLSADKSAQLDALKALDPISNSATLSRERLCGQFYPQSWASLTFYSNPNDPALRMIGVHEKNTYEALRESWLELLASNPIDYLQIKVFQFSQLFLAGDSIRVYPDTFKQFFLLPYESIKALRLLSFAPTLLLISWLTFSSRFKAEVRIRRSLLITYLLSIGIVTVAFIGDNQRYISWLAMLILFSFINANSFKLSREAT